MITIKVWFQTFVLFSIVWFSSMGCVTKQIWSDSTQAKPYKEQIVSFYSNVEKDEILFLGEHYHYIFNQRTKPFMLLLKERRLLGLSNKNVSVYASLERQDNRKVQAHIRIHLKKSELNTEQIKVLEKNNFISIQADPYYGTEHMYEDHEAVDTVTTYTNEYYIEGTRYIADPKVNESITKLKKPMEIEVVEFFKENKKSNLYKVAMTPLSVTADAGLIIIGVGAAIIYAPFFLTYMAYEEIKGK
jgi:hypothetical protein